MITLIIGFMAGVIITVAIVLLFFQKRKLYYEVASLRAQIKDIPTFLNGLPAVPKEKTKEIIIKGLQAGGEKAMDEYKWDEAIDYFQKALSLANGRDKAIILDRIGRCQYVLGRLDQALANLKESLEIAIKFQDHQGEATNLGNIGLIYQAKEDLEQAMKYHQEALKINRQIGFKEGKEGEANQLSNIGLIYRAKGDLDQALKYHQEALKIDEEICYKQGEASDLGNIGVVYQARGGLDQALKYHQKALEINKQIGRKEGEANQLGNIGLIYRTKGDLDQALRYFNEVLRIFEEIGIAEQIGITKRNIERISQEIKQMKKAEDQTKA